MGYSGELLEDGLAVMRDVLTKLVAPMAPLNDMFNEYVCSGLIVLSGLWEKAGGRAGNAEGGLRGAYRIVMDTVVKMDPADVVVGITEEKVNCAGARNISVHIDAHRRDCKALPPGYEPPAGRPSNQYRLHEVMLKFLTELHGPEEAPKVFERLRGYLKTLQDLYEVLLHNGGSLLLLVLAEFALWAPMARRLEDNAEAVLVG